jgi:hypothetical protein
MVKNFLNLYNHEQKVRWLEETYRNDDTRQTNSSILISASKFEQDKVKDLCNFSYADVVELMIGLKRKSFQSLDVSQTIIVKYVDWCIQEGYSKTGINAFKLLTNKDLKKYTHQVAIKNSYITRERLYEICNELYNYTDKAILVLLFEGIRGRTEIDNSYEEIRNLKPEDVMPEANAIRAIRNPDKDNPTGKKRYVQVDKRSIDILLLAIQQTEYHKSNGKATGRFAIRPLKDNGYVIRTIDNNLDLKDDKIASASISTKFNKIRLYTGIHFLTPTLVFQSGLIEKIEEKEKEFGELKPEHYRQIYKDLELDERLWYKLKEIYEAYKQNKVSG